MRCGRAVVPLLVLAVLARGAPATAQRRSSVPLPNSIAAIGDSITRAFDVCCFYGDYPEHSWATGYDGTDVVSSQYERILAQNPAIEGHYFNDAVTGAQMDDAPGQAASVVSQGAEYVTVLMGANDLCTGSPSTMTRPADFQSQYLQALATLE